MKRNHALSYGISLVVIAIAVWGCPKKSEVTGAPAALKNNETASTSRNETAGSPGKPVVNANNTGEASERAARAAGLKSIFFDFDSAGIREDTRKILAENAQWLKANPRKTIRIEGNCDERGTQEYNLGLGQRRAVSAKTVLAQMGIAENRITLISYGKKKPVCTESSDECWQKNRRDEFTAME